MTEDDRKWAESMVKFYNSVAYRSHHKENMTKALGLLEQAWERIDELEAQLDGAESLMEWSDKC